MRHVECQRQPCAGRSGFTLIELLITAAILGLVTAAIAACLTGGVRVWDAARSFGRVESDALVGLRILERDLMNAVPFDAVPFAGTSRSMTMPALVPASAGPDPEGLRLGTVRYAMDSPGSRLLRSQWRFPGDAPAGSGAEPVVANLASVRFSYAAHDGEGGIGEWQLSWDNSSNFPARVKVDLRLDAAGGDIDVTRTVILPLAPDEEEEEDDETDP